MIVKIFGTPVWNFKIDIPEDLVERIYKLREVDPKGREYSNVGGWQSNNIDFDPHFRDIRKLISELLPEVYKDVYNRNDRKPKLCSTWINVNTGKDINIPHIHPLSHIAGCVYIKCNKDSGPIKFENPMNDLMRHYDLHQTTVNTDVFQWEIDYNPSIGDVLFFPSWLYHSVMPSQDNEERISIAFNTALE
jgi:uncharacterized protein (TIGR02466 family)